MGRDTGQWRHLQRKDDVDECDDDVASNGDGTFECVVNREVSCLLPVKAYGYGTQFNIYNLELLL